MEFTSFDDLKNLLGSEGLDGKARLMQRNIIGSSIKVRKNDKRISRMGSINPNAQLVINKDTEMLNYEYSKSRMEPRAPNQTFQDTGKSLF